LRGVTVAKKTHKWTKLSTLLIKQGGTFNMPGHFQIKVVLVPKAEEKAELDTNSCAEFEHDSNIISLRTSRNLKQRRADLDHELQHACVDWIEHTMHKVRIRVK